jgi:hypothetical protein
MAYFVDLAKAVAKHWERCSRYRTMADAEMYRAAGLPVEACLEKVPTYGDLENRTRKAVEVIKLAQSELRTYREQPTRDRGFVTFHNLESAVDEFLKEMSKET